MNAKEMFRVAYGGNKNLMSDYIHGYRKVGLNRAVEISSGRALIGEGRTYGVSVVDAIPEGVKGNSDLFQTFKTKAEADEYIQELKQQYREEHKKQKEKEKAIAEEEALKPIKKRLREIFEKNNKTVYCVLKKVSSSGMYRHITFYTISDGEPITLDRDIIRLGLGDSKDDAVGVGGCGMDMGFHIVYNLSSTLYRDEGRDRSGYILKHYWK